jgi:hypothetical protein
MGVTAFPAFVVSLPVGLAVVYGLAAFIWYELLRFTLLGRVARARRRKARLPAFEAKSREQAELRESERAEGEQEALEASEPDLARRLYYLARKSAAAERDLAIQTANEAAEHAVERIESRYREIGDELDRDEDERLKNR